MSRILRWIVRLARDWLHYAAYRRRQRREIAEAKRKDSNIYPLW